MRILFLLLLALAVVPVFAQGNPFLSGGSTGNTVESSAEVDTAKPHGPSTWPVVGTLLAKTAKAQREFQQTIATAMTEVNETGNIRSLGVLLGISFLFGILHAIGPGHRKAVLMVYFLGEGTKPLKGIATSFLLALAHAASAILLVGGFYLFTASSLLLSVDRAQNLLFPITCGIIFVLGIWMLIHGIKDFRSGDQHKDKTGGRDRGIGGLILSGLVPCPAASAIMILAVAAKALPVGILSVLAMSLGMVVLLASTGLLAILMRSRMTAFLGNTVRGRNIEFGLQVFSGLAMALFGLVMTLGSL